MRARGKRSPQEEHGEWSTRRAIALVRLAGGAVLLVGDFFQPNNLRAVECLTQCGPLRSLACAAPVLLSRWDPHRVTWRDFADRAAPKATTRCRWRRYIVR